MITSKFNPGLVVLDAIRRNHPVDLVRTLRTLLTHLLGAPEFISEARMLKAANDFLSVGSSVRVQPFRFRVFGKTEIIIDAHDGKLRLIDGTDDQRLSPLWYALTNTLSERPQEGGGDGKAQGFADGTD